MASKYTKNTVRSKHQATAIDLDICIPVAFIHSFIPVAHYLAS